MRIDALFERNYRGPLYHATGLGSLQGILFMGGLRLNHAEDMHERETAMQPTGYEWYMCTSRTKINYFRRKVDITSNPVTIVFDADTFNKKDYIVQPENYYRTANYEELETEERIWSKTAWIQISDIQEVHMLLSNITNINLMKDAGLNLDELKMPFFIYDDVNAYLLLDKRRAIVNPPEKPL